MSVMETGADTSSTIQLGHMYSSNCVASPADDAAYKAYKGPADEGYPEAQIGLSRVWLEGRGVDPSPYQAYLWARLAELRSPAGELQSQAKTRREMAARLMSKFEITDAENMAKSLIATASEPMNK